MDSAAAAAPVAPAPSAAPAAALPAGIEIFKAGTHIDSAGRQHTFTAADLQQMAGSYNAALREAPLTVGHPKDNLPAYGWVKKVFINAAGNLAVDPDQVDPAFAAMVKAGRFKKRSASFYPPDSQYNPTPGKWYLRHVAFLGAQPPAVPGLKDLEYAAGDAAAALVFDDVQFSQPADVRTPAAPASPAQPKERLMSDADKAELDKLRAENKANADALAKAQAATKAAQDAAAAAQKQAASFAEKAASDRRAGFASFAEAQIKAGKLLPKDKNTAVAALEALAAVAEPYSFSEGSNTEQVTALQLCAWLQGEISSRTAAVQFGEFNPGAGAAGFDARGKTDAEVDAAARKYQAEHPNVNYAEALRVVATFTE